MDRQLRRQRAEHAAHQLVGIGPALVDLHAGMTADQALEDDAAEDAPGRLIVHRHMAGGPDAAGTGHGEDALHLGIDVKHHPALQHGGLQGHGPQHADLLAGGQHHLQPGMGQGLVVQGCQGHGHGDSVIAAQGSALGPDVGSVGLQPQALPLHIQVTVLLPVADHIQVPLENHRRNLLIARRSSLDNDHIFRLILPHRQVPRPGKGNTIIADGAGIAGPVGDGADFFKIVQHFLRLHLTQNRHFSASSQVYLGILSQNVQFANKLPKHFP